MAEGRFMKRDFGIEKRKSEPCLFWSMKDDWVGVVRLTDCVK